MVQYFEERKRKKREYGICMWYVCESGFLVKTGLPVFTMQTFCGTHLGENFLRGPLACGSMVTEGWRGFCMNWMCAKTGPQQIILTLDLRTLNLTIS